MIKILIGFSLIVFVASCFCIPDGMPRGDLKGVAINPDDPDANCLDIMLAICLKGEVCEAEGWEHCWDAAPTACGRIDGITIEEVSRCTEAIKKMACDDSSPSECLGIGTPKEPPAILGMPG